jgi:hypothetical protein
MDILYLAGQIYDHLRYSYGWFGIAFVGLCVVLAIRAVVRIWDALGIAASAILANVERARVRKLRD